MGYSICFFHGTAVRAVHLDHTFEPPFPTRWSYLLRGMTLNINSLSILIWANNTSFVTVFSSINPTLEPDWKRLGLNFSTPIYLCMSSLDKRSFPPLESRCRVSIISFVMLFSISSVVLTPLWSDRLVTATVSFETVAVLSVSIGTSGSLSEPMFAMVLWLPSFMNDSVILSVAGSGSISTYFIMSLLRWPTKNKVMLGYWVGLGTVMVPHSFSKSNFLFHLPRSFSASTRESNHRPLLP